MSLEDGEAVLHWRLRRICDWLDVPMESLAGQLVLIDGSRLDAALMTETREGMEITATYSWLRESIAQSRCAVLFVDGASDAFDANENQRRAVRRFVRSLRKLIPDDGAGVLLAHVDKATARNSETSQGYSGSTAWSNSVRARWYLRPEDDGSLTLEVQKTNHAKAGASMRLEWNEAASLFLGELAMPASKLERDLAQSDEREAVLGLIRTAQQNGNPVPAASAGSRTSWHVLSAMPGFPNALTGKTGRARLFAILETLQAARVLTRTTEKYGQRNSREVLHAT